MITEDYVSFEVAKLLKEKGFEEQTLAFYLNENEHLYIGNYYLEHNGSINCMSAPTLQMAMKWLREVYNKHIYAVPVVTDDDGVMGYWWEDCIITNRRYNTIRTGKLYNSPEEAAENAIKYCLNNLI